MTDESFFNLVDPGVDTDKYPQAFWQYMKALYEQTKSGSHLNAEKIERHFQTYFESVVKSTQYKNA